MRFRFSLMAIAAFGLASVCGLSVPAQAQNNAPPSLATSGVDTGSSEVALKPGDSIRIRVLREPDLSGEFGVDEKGFVTLPRLGPTQVTNVTPDSLKARIISTIGSTLRDPTIEVTLLRRVTILGAVQKPGVYGADPTMTIADVLALAGGATADGKRDHVTVYRGGAKYRADIATATSLNSSGIRSGDQIYVEERSWISRNPYLFTGILGSTIAIIALIARR